MLLQSTGQTARHRILFTLGSIFYWRVIDCSKPDHVGISSRLYFTTKKIERGSEASLYK